jgi:hypothetical protein
MSLTKRVGLGVILNCDPTGGITYTALGSIVDHIDGADAKTTVYDSSLLTDKFTTKGGAQIDPGSVTFTIAYDPLDTSTTTVLTALLASSAIAGWQLLYPIIGTEVQQKEPFKGLVSGFKRGVKKGAMITADVTISVSGDPGFTGG